MIQRIVTADEIAQDIAARIAHAVHPWRIVLFGSRARGDARPDSDYDLFVEVEADRAGRRKIDDAISALFPARPKVDVKVAPAGEIERRRDDHGALEWDVAREGCVLYADPAAPVVLAPPDRVRERPVKPPESVWEWLEVAERDFEACRNLFDMGERHWAHVCFYAQQTAEKSMKALLIARGVRPPRTHVITELLAALRASGCAMVTFDEDAMLLEKHAVAPRYTWGLDLTEEHARAALSAAERMIAMVRAELPPRVH